MDLVIELWKQSDPDANIIPIAIAQDSKYRFDFSPLDKLDPAQGTGFVVFDERFGNVKRSELMQAAIERGIKLTNFVSPRAFVPEGTKLGINVFIADGVTLGTQCRVDYNSFIYPGTHIGNNVHIKPSCWISRGVVIGDEVEIGRNCTIHTGASIANGVKVGNHCNLGWKKIYDKDIKDKTFFEPGYSEIIQVFDN